MAKQIYKKLIIISITAIFILLVSGYAFEISADDDYEYEEYSERYENYEDDDKYEYEEKKYSDDYGERDDINSKVYNKTQINSDTQNTTYGENEDNKTAVYEKNTTVKENNFIVVKDNNRNGIVDDFEFSVGGKVRRIR